MGIRKVDNCIRFMTSLNFLLTPVEIENNFDSRTVSTKHKGYL